MLYYFTKSKFTFVTQRYPLGGFLLLLLILWDTKIASNLGELEVKRMICFLFQQIVIYSNLQLPFDP